jgi:hypothetical protein
VALNPPTHVPADGKYIFVRLARLGTDGSGMSRWTKSFPRLVIPLPYRSTGSLTHNFRMCGVKIFSRKDRKGLCQERQALDRGSQVPNPTVFSVLPGLQPVIKMTQSAMSKVLVLPSLTPGDGLPIPAPFIAASKLGLNSLSNQKLANRFFSLSQTNNCRLKHFT